MPQVDYFSSKHLDNIPIFKAYEACRLCPKQCGVNRLKGERGACGMIAQVRLARASLHMWEEPSISGCQGSGTLFFSGCNLSCVYCQNRTISQQGWGQELSLEDLVRVMLKLQALGAANINLVTGLHFIPHIRAAILAAKARGLLIPIVYNSSAYEAVPALRALNGLIDIYLPDFRYWEDTTARKYSQAPRYREIAQAALAEMFRQVGPCQFKEGKPDPESPALLSKGLVCRQLLLPGQLDQAKAITHYLYTHYGDQIYLSLMSQYTPLSGLELYPELQSTVDPKDYEDWLDYAQGLGVENAYIQEGAAASESFIPDFASWSLEDFLAP
ncbi:MAG: radical SAM protein [Eubacteriales bacterium]|nr:radical SAM protein [Clostridiales bacterium]MDY5837061.1 radical SAM protein [Eubacteriales bacterium]